MCLTAFCWLVLDEIFRSLARPLRICFVASCTTADELVHGSAALQPGQTSPADLPTLR